MVDYNNMLSTILLETADQHLPPLKKKKANKTKKEQVNKRSQWVPLRQLTSLQQSFTLQQNSTECSKSMSQECLVCDMVFQSFGGFDYSPRSCLPQWPAGSIHGFWFSQGVFGIASAVVFGCSWVCCSPCRWTLACFEGFATVVGKTVISTGAELTAVWGWIKGGGDAEGFSWTLFLRIVVPWEAWIV